jgi:two-component system chemotaxis response regulator CheB
VLIAPGGFHLEIFRNEADKIQTRITSTPPVNSCRPSADVLFESAAKCNLRGALAIILTGMGSDGADGVASLKKSCPTWCIAQDAATSTVYGMPQAIAQRDLQEEILPLQDIAARVNSLFRF